MCLAPASNSSCCCVLACSPQWRVYYLYQLALIRFVEPEAAGMCLWVCVKKVWCQPLHLSVGEMTTFDLSMFVANPTLAKFYKCRKSELFELAGHYGVSVAPSLLKKDLRTALLDYLVAEGNLHISTVVEPPGSPAVQVPCPSPSGEGAG